MAPLTNIRQLEIPDIIEIVPTVYMDERGWFSEIYNQRVFSRYGIDVTFVQDNQSYSEKPGTVRGLHYQLPPSSQAKLVRVLRGRALSVVVDIRRSSPTFGRHVKIELSAGAGNQVFVPTGFAHGFCTLDPQTEVFYKASAFFDPETERGINWADPALGIAWPVKPAAATLSPKDVDHPMFAEQPDLFA